MKVYNINSVYPQTGFGSKKYNRQINKDIPHSSPLKDSMTTAGAWFAFGVILDFLSRKISFFKSPAKNSFAINGIIAATAGIVAGYKSASRNH